MRVNLQLITSPLPAGKLTGTETQVIGNSTYTKHGCLSALPRGPLLLEQADERRYETAIDYFNQAIEIDSNYALAYPAWLTHGDKVWRDPVTHAGENVGDAEAHALLIGCSDPASPRK